MNENVLKVVVVLLCAGIALTAIDIAVKALALF